MHKLFNHKTAKKTANRLAVLLLIVVAPFPNAKAQLLWEISGNSTNAKSYIFATDILTDISFLDSVPNFFRIFNRASNIITEMELTDSTLQSTIAQNALLPDTLTLKNLYSISDYSELSQAVMLYLNMPIKTIEKLKPIYINELIRLQLLKLWVGYDESRTMDPFVQELALQTGKNIVGLDNIGEIIYVMFDREQINQQTHELLRTIRKPENEIKQQKRISELYQLGKLNEIAYQVEMPDNQTTISYSDYKIYCARNKEWIKKLTPYLKEGNQLLVLNCIYLGGDNGLINQLRKTGYKVRAYNKL